MPIASTDCTTTAQDYSFDCTLYDKDSLCHLSVTDSSHSELCLMASTQGDEFDDEGPEFVEASYTIMTWELRVVPIAVSCAAFVAAVVVLVVIVYYRRRRRSKIDHVDSNGYGTLN